MDLNLVSQYLSSNQPVKVANVPSGTDPEGLGKARELYISHRGRLPSPKPPDRLQPSERTFVDEFSSDMRSFLERSHDKDAKEAYICISWEELQAEAAGALERFGAKEARRRSWRNPFEAADRAGGAVARRIEFLIELVPDGDYTAILSGGLKLLYNTAKRKKEIRQQILETLDSLGNAISHTKAEIRLYSQDQDLKDRSEALYMSILDFVKQALTYLDKNSALESFKAFFQQTDYGSKLDSVIDNIKTASALFEDCVSVCLQRRVQDMHKNVESLTGPVLAIYFLLAGFLKDFPALFDQLKIMERRNVAMLYTQQLMQSSSPQPAISAQQMRHLLSSDWQAGAAFATEDALTRLNRDLHTALGFVPSQLNQEQIGLLISDNAFIRWLKFLASDLVVLHDDSALQENSSLSVLSYLCAVVSKTLSTPGIFPLTFFCGLNSTIRNDGKDGGYSIMRCLILQLLQAFGNTSFPIAGDPNLIVQGLILNDLRTAFTIFTMLLQNIPAGIVYVVVDGAFWYATEERIQDMQEVMCFLSRLVTELQVASRGLVLKVLITNPTPRQRSSWGFQASDIYLDQSLVTGGHQLPM